MAWRNIVVTQHCKVSMKMNLLVVQTDDDTVQIPIDDIGMVLVVPEKLRTLDHGRPWSDDQFASTRLSSNRDMSR